MNTADIIFEKAIHVNNFECDVNHRLKPAAFFQHLTESAGDHATLLGCGFQEMLAQNLYWVHSRMKIKFFRFPGGGDQITIQTWPKTIQQKIFYIRDYVILDAEGALIAAATSAWLIIDATSRRMVMPQSITLSLPSLPERIGLDEPLEKLALSQNGEERMSIQAGYSAVDILGHVNNSRYVDWVCDAFPIEMHRKHSLDWMQINYEREILPAEEVTLISSHAETDPNLWSVEGLNQTSGKRAFEAQLKWK